QDAAQDIHSLDRCQRGAGRGRLFGCGRLATLLRFRLGSNFPPLQGTCAMSDQSLSPPTRLTSLDAYRGFIMLVMASGGFAFAKVAREHFQGDPVWGFLAYQFDHVAWGGCAFWDLIQPSFMFMVG